jgi:hypothetical protein
MTAKNAEYSTIPQVAKPGWENAKRFGVRRLASAFFSQGRHNHGQKPFVNAKRLECARLPALSPPRLARDQ